MSDFRRWIFSFCDLSGFGLIHGSIFVVTRTSEPLFLSHAPPSTDFSSITYLGVPFGIIMPVWASSKGTIDSSLQNILFVRFVLSRRE